MGHEDKEMTNIESARVWAGEIVSVIFWTGRTRSDLVGNPLSLRRSDGIMHCFLL